MNHYFCIINSNNIVVAILTSGNETIVCEEGYNFVEVQEHNPQLFNKKYENKHFI